MTLNEAQARHTRLADEIRRHDHAYYVVSQPDLTDYEYDRLYQELLDLEKQFPALITAESPSQRVGGAPAEGFTRVKHLQPMLSLEKVEAAEHPTQEEEPDRDQRNRLQDENTLPSLQAFDATIRKQLGLDHVEYVMEPKVDGVSISVHYRNGKLALGVTRGDGVFGDDITTNLRTVRAIPLELTMRNPPALLEVRGEAYMANKDFDELNAKLATAGEKPLPNARNATAGTLKQLDPRIVAKRPVKAVFYAVGACEGIEFESHAEMLKALAGFGLPTQKKWWLCQDIAEVLRDYREEVVRGYDGDRDLRRQLPYEIDGIVLKVNRYDDCGRIPGKTRAPGYAVVHKPIPWITPAETILRDITVQVGRTGVLTPVAELEPVFVQGSTISRATLHNEDEIHRKDVRIGDTVVIRKAGMVIPEVLGVLKSKRPPGAKEFDLYKFVAGKCPACGGPIAKEKVSDGGAEEVAWRCQNVAGCPAQLMRRVEYFAQRKALDIESLGGIVAEKLVERGLVKDPLDLFDLKLEQLGNLNLGTDEEPRTFGEKNATKILEALERSKTYPLARWLYALGVANVGEATALYIGKWHTDFEDVANSNLLKLIGKEGQLRARDSAEGSSDENNDEKLISRRREIWALIRQEIGRRSNSNENLRREVDQERVRLNREIDSLLPQRDKLENDAALHKERQKREAALHKEQQQAKPHAQREKFQKTKLSKELQNERAKIKGRLATLEERLNKAGMPEELGPVVAKSALDFFGSKAGGRILSRLSELEIWPQGGLTHSTDQKVQGLAGKTFVLTGTLQTLSRDEASALIRDAGGNVTGSVSKNTDFLLAGEEAGSKLDKARTIGVTILSEKEFLEMIGSNAANTRPKQSGPAQGSLV